MKKKFFIVLMFLFSQAGCGMLFSGNKITTADLQYFPATVGNFKRCDEPSALSHFISCNYKDGSGAIISYDLYDDSSAAANSYALRGEVLFKSPEFSIYFSGESLRIVAANGGKTAVASTYHLNILNDWENNFPYEKLGFKTPQPLPVKIELPPADYLKELGKIDPDTDKAMKQAILSAVQLWAQSVAGKPVVKISEIDPTSLVAIGSVSQEDISKFVADNGGNLRATGFRQIFFGGVPYPFPPLAKKDKTAASNSNKSAANNQSVSPGNKK